MNSKKQLIDKKEGADQPLVSVLKGVGLRSATGVKLLRRLLAAGNIQPVLEGVAEVLLNESIQSGRVPANVGVPTQDFAMAVEGAITDVVNEYHLGGNPLTSRSATPLQLIAEMCKRWLSGFAEPIHESFDVPGAVDDPEVSGRLTVVALAARDMIAKRAERRQETVDGAAREVWVLPDTALEDFCRSMSVALFLAFKHPNEANHRLVHGAEP